MNYFYIPIAIAFNVYVSIFHGKVKSRVSLPLNGKIAIVTGSNTGIGKEVAAKLYRNGCRVIMACRSEERAKEAMLDIEQRSFQSSSSPYTFGDIKYMHLDLSDLKSVITFVNEFFQAYDHVDILVNNAGLNTKGASKQGLQQLFQVNYLGHYLLTRSLIYQQNQRAATINDQHIKKKIRVV